MLGDYHLLLSSLGSLFLVLRKSFSVHAHSPYSALIHKLSPLSGTYILGTKVWKVWKKERVLYPIFVSCPAVYLALDGAGQSLNWGERKRERK